MKVKIKLEFRNGMVFESQEWNQIKSNHHLEFLVQEMIEENGVELGKPTVKYITDPEEKRDIGNLAWTPTKIGEISEGNYVTQILSKHPRKIARIEKTEHLVTLYEEGRNQPYFKANPEYPMDLLIDHITKEAVTDLEAYYE
jgi:hypothetical protein